ncbi:MAG: hypothetical protein ACREEP_12890, partial [Dongiaceae bacterium]
RTAVGIEGGTMHKVKLDPRKLLGFKIIAGDESPARLQSPKIGGKGCANFDTAAETMIGAPMRPKIGSKD